MAKDWIERQNGAFLAQAESFTVRLRDQESPHRRARPRHVSGAEVFYAVAEHAPARFEDWRRGGLTMSAKATVRLPLLPPGTKVWLSARWFNGRGESGPASQAV